MKDMFKDMVSLFLEAEMDETLGYSKHERCDVPEANGYYI